MMSETQQDLRPGGRGVWRARLWIGIVSAIFLTVRGGAQTRATTRAPLTVRPHDMATGTINPAAGEYLLDSLPEMTPEVRQNPYIVYIPARCVGAHRCPLLLHLHGAGSNSRSVSWDYRAAADKYGMIILLPSAVHTVWAVGDPGTFSLTEFEPDRKNIDAALHQVLRRFAIDPDKIVISGVSQGCWPTRILGGTNMNVFSRIVQFGSPPPLMALDPPAATVEILTVEEFPDAAGVTLTRQLALERAGYRSTLISAPQWHGVYLATADFVGQWLRESWATPTIANRTPPRRIDAVPILTPQTFALLVSTWQQINDGVSQEQRIVYMRETLLPILTANASTLLTDMPVMAAHVPAVAAILARAGLPPSQFDALRLALISARLTSERVHRLATSDTVVTPRIDSTSALGHNVLFVTTHASDIDPLNTLFESGP